MDVADRRAQLEALTGVKHQFEKAWSMVDAEARLAERLIHLKLRPLLVKGRKSVEVYKLSLKRIREIVEWAMRLSKEVYARGVPRDLTDDEVVDIASKDDPDIALVEMATRGACNWRDVLKTARWRVDDIVADDVAERMLSEFHEICFSPGRMVREGGKFIYLDPGSDLHEIKVSRRHLERIIDGAKRRARV